MKRSFGAALKALREIKGWDVSTLAYKARLKSQTIRKLERGLRNDPYASTVGKLSDALEISADDLLLEAGMKERKLPSNPGLSPAETELIEAIRAVNPLEFRARLMRMILSWVKGEAATAS